jgi:hypothetical protein
VKKTRIISAVILIVLLVVPAFADEALISEVVDGDLTGGKPKWVEITNCGETPVDLGEYRVLVYANGNLTPSLSTSYGDMVGALEPGASFVIAKSDCGPAGEFISVYGFEADLYDTAISGNGNDVYELVKNDGVGGDIAVDIYGVIGEGMDYSMIWAYQDSYAYRLPDSMATETFDANEWFFGGNGALDHPNEPEQIQALRDCTVPAAHMCYSRSLERTVYVDPDAHGFNNGSSWIDAYNYLQDALADARSDANVSEIRVAEGVYTPDSNFAKPAGSGDRNATFQLTNGVALSGGYAGFSEPDPNERDVKFYETILSGDINTPDVNVDNSYHVVTASGTDWTAVLDGFTITGGNANGADPNNKGAGMYNNSGSPTVSSCTFSGNSAYHRGGGMYNYQSDPNLTNCTFSDNLAHDDGGGACNYESSTTVTACTFSGNWAADDGGGMDNRTGDPVVTNCSFSGNWTNDDAGAMYNWYSSARLINCTFSGNSAPDVGGGIYNYQSSPNITNCILWGNSDNGGEDESAQIHGGTPVVSYSCIQGLDTLAGNGNIDDDPCFADPCNDDYHLKSQGGRYDPQGQTWVDDELTSLCIDAGDPDGSIGYELFPNGGVVNMGSYGGTIEASKSYFGKPACDKNISGDINGDCIINFVDFAFMAAHWLAGFE